MVRGHAPRYFAAQGLAPVLARALAGVGKVPRTLPRGLSALEAMSRLDAAWVEWASGQAPRLPAPAAVRACQAELEAREGALWAWLLGQLDRQARSAAGGAGAGRGGGPEAARLAPDEQLYLLTHEILLGTRYLTRAPRPGAYRRQAVQLADAVALLALLREADLLAEVAFCLQVVGADARPALEALLAQADERGEVGEQTGYLGAHAAAASLVAFSGALDRARSRKRFGKV